jgi:hypothetical protein
MLLVIAISSFVYSCGDKADDSGPKSVRHPEARFLASQPFSFSASLDPSTLEESQTVSLNYSGTDARPETYVIGSSEELTAFMQITNTAEREVYYQGIFSNLDTQTYLLIKGPSCPEYYEYAGYQDNPPVIVVRVNHFILDGGLCADEFSDAYYALRGMKK